MGCPRKFPVPRASPPSSGSRKPTHEVPLSASRRISVERLERRRGLVDAREPEGLRTLSHPSYGNRRRPTRVGTLCQPSLQTTCDSRPPLCRHAVLLDFAAGVATEEGELGPRPVPSPAPPSFKSTSALKQSGRFDDLSVFPAKNETVAGIGSRKILSTSNIPSRRHSLSIPPTLSSRGDAPSPPSTPRAAWT